jgi:hypothetical protein
MTRRSARLALGLWAIASPALATGPAKVRVVLDADTANQVDNRGRPRARQGRISDLR